MVPAYRSTLAAREIMHFIAATIRAARGEDITKPSFSALASDSPTDWGANKQELVYARTVSMGRSRTFFVGLQDLQAGTAVAILAAYKQVMLRGGLAEFFGTVRTRPPSCSPPRTKENSWYTSTSQQGHKLGHWNLCQVSEEKIKIPGVPAEANRGINWDTGTYGKHRTKNLKFLVRQQRPPSA